MYKYECTLQSVVVGAGGLYERQFVTQQIGGNTNTIIFGVVERNGIAVLSVEQPLLLSFMRDSTSTGIRISLILHTAVSLIFTEPRHASRIVRPSTRILF
jgi:hypothetical protein